MKLDLQGIGMTSQRTRDRLVQRLRQQGIQNERVLEVMASTPRHLFLDEALAHRAYEDSALPIGYQQTISQPYIVAKMTELLLADGPRNNVLEVGTGSGYQTAILSPLVGRVYSIERIRPLLEQARERVRALGLRNVFLRHADGYLGWKERGPFDAILAAAAPENVPEELIDQLAVGGRLVMPVGSQRSQQLILIEKREDGIQRKAVAPVVFVPLQKGVVV